MLPQPVSSSSIPSRIGCSLSITRTRTAAASDGGCTLRNFGITGWRNSSAAIGTSTAKTEPLPGVELT